MSDLKKEIGLRIKARRQKLSLTQEEVAEKLEISVKHISEVERGVAGLSVENLAKLSNILGLSLDYLVKGESEDPDNILSLLQSVPIETKKLLNELINLGVKLSKN